MTRPWRTRLRAVAAIAVLLAGPACHRHEGDREAKHGASQAGSAGSVERGRAGARSRSVYGWVVRAGKEEVVIRRGAGDAPDLRLEVGPRTTVIIRGRRRAVGELHEGTHVRASYDPSGPLPQALRIEAIGRRRR